MEIALHVHVVVQIKSKCPYIQTHTHTLVRSISSNISGCTGLIFAIFSPYESVLRADDGSVPYFPICQGTLPWQPNNVAVMKAN